jgi:hypothetical protein
MPCVRARFGLTSPRVLRSDLRRIYRAEGIQIDLWPHKLRKLRGAYINDEFGPTVMLAKGLPQDPMVFTMGHELKTLLGRTIYLPSGAGPAYNPRNIGVLHA